MKSDHIDGISIDFFRQLAELEAEQVGDASELTMRSAVATICHHPEWPTFTSRMAFLRDNLINEITRKRMDEYSLGLRQGMVRTLSSLLSTVASEEKDLAEIRERITMRQSQIQELRNLLN